MNSWKHSSWKRVAAVRLSTVRRSAEKTNRSQSESGSAFSFARDPSNQISVTCGNFATKSPMYPSCGKPAATGVCTVSKGPGRERDRLRSGEWPQDVLRDQRRRKAGGLHSPLREPLRARFRIAEESAVDCHGPPGPWTHRRHRSPDDV